MLDLDSPIKQATTPPKVETVGVLFFLIASAFVCEKSNKRNVPYICPNCGACASFRVNINVLVSTRLDIQTGPEQEIELDVDSVHGDDYDFDP